MLPLPWESHSHLTVCHCNSNTDGKASYQPACGGVGGGDDHSVPWSSPVLQTDTLFLVPGEPQDIVAINTHLRQELQSFLNNIDL